MITVYFENNTNYLPLNTFNGKIQSIFHNTVAVGDRQGNRCASKRYFIIQVSVANKYSLITEGKDKQQYQHLIKPV